MLLVLSCPPTFAQEHTQIMFVFVQIMYTRRCTHNKMACFCCSRSRIPNTIYALAARMRVIVNTSTYSKIHILSSSPKSPFHPAFATTTTPTICLPGECLTDPSHRNSMFFTIYRDTFGPADFLSDNIFFRHHLPPHCQINILSVHVLGAGTSNLFSPRIHCDIERSKCRRLFRRRAFMATVMAHVCRLNGTRKSSFQFRTRFDSSPFARV